MTNGTADVGRYGKITNGATNIGQYGYTHWTNKPLTPGRHEVAFVPQSLFDGWEAYCSCGEWRAYVSQYDYPERDETIKCLGELHAAHVAESDKLEGR